MENYLDMLMNDHALIEKALVLFEKEAEKNHKLNVKIANSLLDFLWEYGDVCHNAKEEKVYFPLLLNKGLPPQGPIGVMLQEHTEERRFIGSLRKMIAEKEETGKLPGEFHSTLASYSEFTKNHIWKENDILYPMGRRILNSEDDAYLQQEFLKIEKETVGEGSYPRFVKLINTIEKQTGEKINLLNSVSTEIMTNMLDVLPIELSFVDENDRVTYFNKLEEKKIFPRTLSVIGRTVQQCHPQKSVHLVNQILDEMKAGTREKASFWINFDTMFVHISYYAVRSHDGIYQGCVEMVHDIKPYRDLDGEKRLLDME